MNDNELHSLLADLIDGIAEIYLHNAQTSAALAALKNVVNDSNPDGFERMYRAHYLEPAISQARHIDDAKIQSLLEVAKKLRQKEKN
jgi:hypothetical protein